MLSPLRHPCTPKWTCSYTHGHLILLLLENHDCKWPVPVMDTFPISLGFFPYESFCYTEYWHCLRIFHIHVFCSYIFLTLQLLKFVTLNNFLFFAHGVFAYVKKHHIFFPVLWCPNAWQLIQMLLTIKFLCLAFQLYYQMVDEMNIIFWTTLARVKWHFMHF